METNVERFLNNISIIEIESNSLCNRKCSYCINAHIYRRNENEVLKEDAYKKLIDDLANIGYERTITFHRYNEPFLKKNNMILFRIAYARKMLPKAKLVISSNGDYLDAEYLDKIAASGLDELYLQCHIENYNSISMAEKKKIITELNSKIGKYQGKFIQRETSIVFVTVKSPFKTLTIEIKDFKNDGFDRGGIITEMGEEDIIGGCFGPLTTMPIDYNGNVMICCNCVSYHKQHKKYVIGNIFDDNIVNIYNSALAKKIQKKLYEGDRLDICKKCVCNYYKYKKEYKIDYIV